MAMQGKTSLYDRLILSIPGMSKLQDWVIDLGNRPSALSWLLSLTFLESIFFPIPTDPLLAGIVLARPHQYIRLAGLMTIASSLAALSDGRWRLSRQGGDQYGLAGEAGAYAEITLHLSNMAGC